MVPTDIVKSIRAASCSKGSAEMPCQACHPCVLEIDSSEDESLDLDEAARDYGYECGSTDHIQSLHDKLAFVSHYCVCCMCVVASKTLHLLDAAEERAIQVPFMFLVMFLFSVRRQVLTTSV